MNGETLKFQFMRIAAFAVFVAGVGLLAVSGA